MQEFNDVVRLRIDFKDYFHLKRHSLKERSVESNIYFIIYNFTFF